MLPTRCRSLTLEKMRDSHGIEGPGNDRRTALIRRDAFPSTKVYACGRRGRSVRGYVVSARMSGARAMATHERLNFPLSFPRAHASTHHMTASWQWPSLRIRLSIGSLSAAASRFSPAHVF